MRTAHFATAPTMALASGATLALARPAAVPAYIALGDSVTLGETDLSYVPSFGDAFVARLRREHPRKSGFRTLLDAGKL